MTKYSLLFLGTPAFAVPLLKSLAQDSQFEIKAVVTQPDRPAGRKLTLTPSAVKVTAESLGLQVWTPEKVSQPEWLEKIRPLEADFALVVAYGQILSQTFLDLFPRGAFNIHGSLLPRWRGAAPFQRAIEAGDRETGLSLQKIVKKLDAGDVIGERRVQVSETETARELHDRLSFESYDLVRKDLLEYFKGERFAQPQDETKVTLAAKLDKVESFLDFKNQSAATLYNKFKAFTLGPGVYFRLGGQRIKILDCAYSDQKRTKTCEIFQEGGAVFVSGVSGSLKLIKVQPESKSALTGLEWFKGLKEFHLDDLDQGSLV